MPDPMQDPISGLGGAGSGDPALDGLFAAIERAAQIDADINYRIMDNHLKHSDRVIANKAALSLINDGELLTRALMENPTS